MWQLAALDNFGKYISGVFPIVSKIVILLIYRFREKKAAIEMAAASEMEAIIGCSITFSFIIDKIPLIIILI